VCGFIDEGCGTVGMCRSEGVCDCDIGGCERRGETVVVWELSGMKSS